MKQKFHSHSAEETEKFGEQLGQKLKAGDVVTLSGELGSGKTTLVKGIAKGLGVSSRLEVSSPTFVLIHEYQGREKVYHMDWYRLKKLEGEDRFLAAECFEDQAVTLIEWPDRGKNLIPREYVEIKLKHVSLKQRLLEVAVHGSNLEL